MQTWIALLRGINVGGKNVLPMKKLRGDLEAIALENIRTYIQSGNVVFETNLKKGASIAKKIGACIEKGHGFRPEIVVVRQDDLVDAIESNPYPEAVSDPKSVHVFFCSEPVSDPDVDSIESAKKSSERYSFGEQVFYLYAPDGIARSKLAANVEKYLGVVATGRNFRTVDKLRSMCESASL